MLKLVVEFRLGKKAQGVNMKGRWILVTNNPSHYREEIYTKLSSEGMDFQFSNGDFSIAKFDTNKLCSNVYFSRCFVLGRFFFVPKSIIRALKYDHIVLTGNFYFVHTWIILILARILKRKTYLWSHAWYGREGDIKKILKKLYFSLSTKILTYGDYARNLMIGEGYAGSNIIPIYNSLSFEKHIRMRESITPSIEDNAADNSPNLIFIGRITPIKNLSILAEALSILLPSYPSLRLRIIGGELDNGVFRNRVRELGLEHFVDFVGECYDESLISEALVKASVCVSPGNVGLTAIHSLTFGTPVISHGDFPNQMPEFESIIPGETGYFFEKGNALDLAEKIKLILEIPSKDYQRMRQRCMQEVDNKWNSRIQLDMFRKLGL